MTAAQIGQRGKSGEIVTFTNGSPVLACPCRVGLTEQSSFVRIRLEPIDKTLSKRLFEGGTPAAEHRSIVEP